jgi:hypothetical protein
MHVDRREPDRYIAAAVRVLAAAGHFVDVHCALEGRPWWRRRLWTT